MAIVGAASTVRLAVLLAAPGDGVCVVVTPEVEFGRTPGELLVTLKITVQLPLAGIVMPLKLKAVAPPASVFGVVPTQVPVTEPPTALIFTSVSVNEAPVSVVAVFELLKVSVTVDVPPTWIEVGLKAFVIVGGAKTVSVAVLLALEVPPASATVKPEVVFDCTPGVLLVTAKVTVQLLLAGTVIPLKLKAVVPATNVFGLVPAQVPVTEPPAAVIFVSMSVKLALV